MVPRPGRCKPALSVASPTGGAAVADLAETGFATAGKASRRWQRSRSEQSAQEPPDSLEESADAGEQAADGAPKAAYHAHLSITRVRITRDSRRHHHGASLVFP
jgi:hypothetical protein